jgi:hypothetical protein
MGIFKTRTNKKFNYTPRYLESDGNPFEIKHKFDEYRKTLGKTSLKGKFENAWDDYKNSTDMSTNRRILVIAGILILIFLLIIEFDLTIFLPKG